MVHNDRRAIDIIYELANSSITAGRDPRCLAAAVLYLASSNTGENVSQKELAEASSKSVVAIRRLVKEIRKQHFFDKRQLVESCVVQWLNVV